MAKRYLDTGFLDQKWIRKLLPERKIFIIYLMLKCDNAGIIDLDMEDAEFWIGKKIGKLEIFLPEGFLIPVIDDKYFMPKFIEWQYKNFPNSQNYLQKQAISILVKHQLFDIKENKLVNNYPIVTQSLGNGKVTVDVDVNASVNVDVKEDLIFPFASEEFKKWWGYWKEYKSKEHKFKYKSVISEQAALKELSNLSDGYEDIALKIIEQSIAKGWKGFFELKTESKVTASTIASNLEEIRRKKEQGYYD